jgi:hypothetical protein
MTRLGTRYEAVKQDLPPDVAFMLREMRTRRDPQFAPVLRLARDNGWTIRTLALEVGMSTEAVARRLQRAAGRVAPGVVIPAAPRHAYVEDPRPPLDPATVSRLRALRRRATRVRGSTPANHPDREAGRQLNAELYVLNQRGYGYKMLAELLGVWDRAISQRIERAIEGYRCDQQGGV